MVSRAAWGGQVLFPPLPTIHEGKLGPKPRLTLVTPLPLGAWPPPPPGAAGAVALAGRLPHSLEAGGC